MGLPQLPPPRTRGSGIYGVLPEYAIKNNAWDWLRAIGVNHNLIKSLSFFVKLYSHSLEARRPIFFTLGYLSSEYPSFIRETQMPDETARRFLIWCVKRGLIYRKKDESGHEWFSKYFVSIDTMNFLYVLIDFAHSFGEVMKSPAKRLNISVLEEGQK